MRKIIYFLAFVFALSFTVPLSVSAQEKQDLPLLMKRMVKAPPQKAEAYTAPYYESFDDSTSYAQWTQINTQQPYYFAWRYYYFNGVYTGPGFNSTPCAWFGQNFDAGKQASDNWFISPGITLKAGNTYRLSNYIRGYFESSIHVYLLTSPTDTVNGRISVMDICEASPSDTYTGDVEVPADGTYYIAYHDNTPWRENGTALRYQWYLDEVKLFAISNNGVPAAIGNLKQVPGQNGEQSMGLKWTLPTKSKQGEDLDALAYVKIFKDQTDSVTISDGVTPGAQMTWTDPNPTPGKHTYSVLVANTTGESARATVNTMVGIDYAGAPENLSVDYDEDGEIITIDWDKPEFGRNGGWYDPTGLTYNIVRQPGNKLLASNYTGNQYEDEDLEEYGNYIYQVSTSTTAGLGATATSQGVVAGSTKSLPIREGWEDETTYPTWTIVDNNNDGHTLYIKHSKGRESATAIGWDYTSTDVDRDESLYSPPVELQAGKKYRLSFYVTSNPYAEFSLDVKYGKGKTQATQTNSVISYASVSAGDYSLATADFEASENGIFYFSWWLHNASSYVWFDDFRIEEILENNIEATSIRNLNTAPTVGEKISTGVTYTNTGSNRSSSFKVQLLDNKGNVLGESTISRPLAAGATGTANISWTVPETAEGQYAIYGKVEMSGDQCDVDNTTSVSYLNVQPKGNKAVTIGTDMTEGNVNEYAPFKHYGYTFSQFIYRASDFNGYAGDIDSLSFKIRGGQQKDYKNLPIRVYLYNTEQDDMNTGWMDPSRMTKVFEGNIDLNMGVYDLVIPFDKAFQYTGGNLGVMVVGDFDDALMLSQGYGLAAYCTEYGLGSTRIFPSNYYYKPDLDNLDNTIGSFYSTIPNAIFYMDVTKTVTVKGTVTDNDGNPVAGATVAGGTISYGYANGYPHVQATTDENGQYTLSYLPVTSSYSQQIVASAIGYQDASSYKQFTAGDTATVDLKMQKCALVTLKGKVTDATDATAGIAGASITLTGDNTITATTAEDGTFEIEGVYTIKPYYILVTKDGYQNYDYYGGYQVRFYDYDGDGISESNIQMSPVTASPYSVSATDEGDKAVITWAEPIADVTATKASNDPIGMFGGAYTLAVGQRFTAAELQSLGADSLYYVKSIRFAPMSTGNFTLAIWQGEEGNEGKVYEEAVTPTTYNDWNTFNLSKPYKIDPTKSIVIGYTLSASSGSYPVSFDGGPLVEGGDALFDATNDVWTSAHEVLPESMHYNWSIQAVLGNDPNSNALPWADADAATMVKQLGNVITLDSIQSWAAKKNDVQAQANYGTKMLDEQTILQKKAAREAAEKALTEASASKKAPARWPAKGYFIYRLEAGAENSGSYFWTRLNDEPVTETTYTDDAWSSLDNKVYRYAVRTYYGGNYSKWSDGTTSAFTYSNGVDKGHYATLNIKVNTNYGTAEGAKVALTGDDQTTYATVGADGVATFNNVRFTSYNVVVTKPYYTHAALQLSVGADNVNSDLVAEASIDLPFAAKGPEMLTATDYITDARLSWETPSPAVTANLTQAKGQHASSYGLTEGVEFIMGNLLEPSDLAEYNYTDFYIDSLKFYANAATTYSPVLYCGISSDQTRQILRMDRKVSEDEVGTWVGVALPEPIKLDPSKYYYIGYAATTESGQQPFSIDDVQNSKGSYTYGYSYYTYSYTWYNYSAYGSTEVAAHITDTKNVAGLLDKNVNYDVYRLAAADSTNLSGWVKLTDQAIQDENYTDSLWQAQPSNNYMYAVKAIYENGAESPASLSKVLKKGDVALLNAKINTNNMVSPAGASVRIQGGNYLYKGVAGADGLCQIPEIAKGTYTLTIAKDGFTTISESINMDEDIVNKLYTLEELKTAPVYVRAEEAADQASVSLTWRAPGEYVPTEGWAYWDNNNPYGGFGTSTGYCALGQLFTPSDQTSKGMKELSISKIAFFPASTNNPPADGATWTVKVWRQTASGEYEEVASEAAGKVTLGTWKEVELSTPYYVSGDETLIIGYIYTGSSATPLGIDNGPLVKGKADWVNFGDGWTELTSAASSWNYNILVHAYLEKLEETPATKAPALAPAQPLSTKKAPKVSVRHSVKKTASAAHPMLASNLQYTGYLVYRLADGSQNDENAWTLLTQKPITTTSFTDEAWANVPSGDYLWAVKAIYMSGNSEAAFSQDIIANTTAINSTTVVSGVTIKQISRQRFLVTTPEAATLYVTNAAGANVLTTGLKAGENIINVNAPAGVYLFKVNGSKPAMVKTTIK